MVTSATYDAARHVATSGHPATEADLREAEEGARQALGSYASRATFDWDVSDPTVVKLHVRAVNPRFLGPTLDTLVGLDEIDRTVVVRVEEFK